MMNVSLHARVNARKLSLFSLYGLIVDSVILRTDQHEDSNAADQASDFFVKQTQVISRKEIIPQVISTLANNDDYDSDIDYYLHEFLSFKKKPEVDLDFCRAIRLGCIKWGDSMYSTLNPYTKKLHIDHFDRIDQAIFLLGYVEYQTLKTPKNILINEMIELSKRFGDPGGTRLINAVFDAWLKTIEGTEQSNLPI